MDDRYEHAYDLIPLEVLDNARIRMEYSPAGKNGAWWKWPKRDRLAYVASQLYMGVDQLADFVMRPEFDGDRFVRLYLLP